MCVVLIILIKILGASPPDPHVGGGKPPPNHPLFNILLNIGGFHPPNPPKGEGPLRGPSPSPHSLRSFFFILVGVGLVTPFELLLKAQSFSFFEGLFFSRSSNGVAEGRFEFERNFS